MHVNLWIKEAKAKNVMEGNCEMKAKMHYVWGAIRSPADVMVWKFTSYCKSRFRGSKNSVISTFPYARGDPILSLILGVDMTLTDQIPCSWNFSICGVDRHKKSVAEIDITVKLTNSNDGSFPQKANEI